MSSSTSPAAGSHASPSFAVTSPADILSYVPHALGFMPEESLVVLAAGAEGIAVAPGTAGPSGLTAPLQPGAAGAPGALARHVVRRVHDHLVVLEEHQLRGLGQAPAQRREQYRGEVGRARLDHEVAREPAPVA